MVKLGIEFFELLKKKIFFYLKLKLYVCKQRLDGENEWRI